MLWAVRHDFTSGAQFAFNFYRHWDTLVIREGDGMCHLLYSKEIVTQGDPLEMVAYGLVILLLIQELQQAHPGITQPCCADDSGEVSTFEGILFHLDVLILKGNPRGYFLDPTKSVLVVSPKNVSRAEALFRGYRMYILTGSR